MNDRYFYRNLPVTDKTFEELISDQKNFEEVPPDWHIIVTDIRNSTGAYEKGKYFEMNIASASCIIIAMNIAKKERLEIPFIYGGDGASIIVPPDLLEETLEELSTLRKTSLRISTLVCASETSASKKFWMPDTISSSLNTRSPRNILKRFSSDRDSMKPKRSSRVMPATRPESPAFLQS